MIFLDFAKAIAQIGDPKFRRVFWRGILLTLALLVAAYALTLYAMNRLGEAAFITEMVGNVTWVGSLLSAGGLFLMVLLSIFLMIPIASAITSMFLDEVADAVEATHYPHLPPTPTPPFWDSVRETINFLGLMLAVNAVALVLALLIAPLAVFIFWGANGFMLGREYFTMVATRHVGRAKAKDLWRRYKMRIWFAGTLMAIPLTIPIANLFIPILGAATFTHQYHRLKKAQPSG